MAGQPDGSHYLSDSSHMQPGCYWCPDCWKWKVDCEHLVEPLPTKRVPLKDYIYTYAAYDRERHILELGMHAGGTYQFMDVPLPLALGLVRAESPAGYQQEHISRKFAFERVRVDRAR